VDEKPRNEEGTMILVGKETKRSASQVLEQATNYFGPDGLGLDVTYRDDASMELQGGGGYIVVRAKPQQDIDMTAVEIESREWEYDVERFLGEI
jgi:hypothetical protein